MIRPEQIRKLPAYAIESLDKALGAYNCAGIHCTDCPLLMSREETYTFTGALGHKTWCAKVYVAALALEIKTKSTLA